MSQTRLGEILLEKKVVSDLQLAEALQVQKEERKRIGDVFVGLGFISKRQLRDFIGEYKKRIPLGEYLVEEGLVKPEDLDFALRKQQRTGQALGEILVETHVITEEQLARALSAQLDMPYVVPYQRMVDARTFSMLPPDFMRHHKILPLYQDDGVATVCVTGPPDEATANHLERVFGHNVELTIGEPARIEETIKGLLDQRTLKDVPDLRVLEPDESGRPPEFEETGRFDMAVEQYRASGIETQAIELVNFIISEAMKEGASDIHVEPLADRLQVRFRIDGLIHHRLDLPLDLHGPMFRRIKALANLNAADQYRDQEGRLLGLIDRKKVDLRVSLFIGVYGEVLNMRYFPHDEANKTLDELEMTTNAETMLRRSIDYASGMIIFAGPPSSGKTTTMVAALNHLIHKKNMKVVMIEDPVEYMIPGAVQTHLASHRDSTVSDVIEAATHQDPDCLAIGQIPYDENARTVIMTALTGQKMMTTIHADDTVGALLRLTDVGLDSLMRSSTALTLLCQRLVRRICPHCRSGIAPEPTLIGQLPVKDFNADKYEFYHGRGCSRCNNTGYLGRVGLFEVMMITDDIRDAYLRGATASEIMAQARASSPYLTLAELGVLQVVRKVTTVEEVLRVAPIGARDRKPENMLTLQEIERLSESTFSAE